jgi:hypothetical protein
MSVFADALAVLHADPNIGSDASYRRPPAAWTALRICLSQPADAVPGFASPGARAATIEATVLSADLAAIATGLIPARGDELTIGGAVHRVESAYPDTLRLSWRLTLAPA